MVEFYPWAIRFLHILAGVSWIGGAFLWSMVVMPRVGRDLPAPHRGPFVVHIAPHASRFIMIAAVGTLVTGVWNMAILAGGFGQVVSAFQAGTWGMTLGAAFVFTVAMFGVSLGVLIPALDKMVAMLAKAPAPAPGSPPPQGPPPAFVALQKRVKAASMTNVLLGTVTLGLMALAVNARLG